MLVAGAPSFLSDWTCHEMQDFCIRKYVFAGNFTFGSSETGDTRHVLLASWKQDHVFLVLAECTRRAHLRLALGERLDRGAALQHLLHVLHALRHLLQPALHVFHRKDQIHDLSPGASVERRTKFSSDLG